jgi:hypothetical protein
MPLLNQIEMSPSVEAEGSVEGVLQMSGRERKRVRVIEAVIERCMTQVAAANRLGLCVRQVKRLSRACRRNPGQTTVIANPRRAPDTSHRLMRNVNEHLFPGLSLVCPHFAG